MDLLDLLEPHPGSRRQAHVDVEHDLAHDHQIVVERQGVEREVHHPFDRILDRHEAEIDLVAADGVEHIGDRAIRDQLTVGQIGLRPQRLLGERAGRPQKGDGAGRQRWPSAGYCLPPADGLGVDAASIGC